MKAVGLVSLLGDQEAAHVARAVLRLGGRPVPVLTDRVPEAVALSWRDGEVLLDHDRLSDLRSFYVRKVHLSLPYPEPEDVSARSGFDTWPERYLAARERHSFVTSVLRSLGGDGRTFVNPLESFDIHFLKLHQLALLAEVGVPVPSTLATSDPRAALEFGQAHREVIYKPLGGGATVRRLTVQDLGEERLSLLRNAPVLFQERIPGDEIRAYLLDGEPLAAFRIPTEGVVDARDVLERAEPTSLEDEVWAICRKAAAHLGLIFTAVDLRRRADGSPVVLELNPTPAFSFYQDPEEGTIVNRLAAYLLDHA